jgi:hypothetical protein
MVYYQIITKYNNQGRIFLNKEQRDILNFKLGISFLTGKKLKETPPNPLKFIGDFLPDEKLPHMLSGDTIPVISDTLYSAFIEAGIKDMEVFPVTIYNKNVEWKNYYAINILSVCDVVDMENSIYDLIVPGTPGFYGFRKLIFSEEKLKNATPIFRIIHNTTRMYINENVGKIIQKLAPPEKWGIDVAQIEII